MMLLNKWLLKTNVNGAVTATITTANSKSWNTSFEGTDAVVQTKIDALNSWMSFIIHRECLEVRHSCFNRINWYYKY
jgi:hypothetical protein